MLAVRTNMQLEGPVFFLCSSLRVRLCVARGVSDGLLQAGPTLGLLVKFEIIFESIWPYGLYQTFIKEKFFRII